MNNDRIQYFILIGYTLTSILALPFVLVMVAATFMPGNTAWLKFPLVALLPVILVGVNLLAWQRHRNGQSELFFLTLLLPLIYGALLFTLIDLY